MKSIEQRRAWSLLSTIALVTTLLVVGSLPVLAQDGLSRQWVEVYIGPHATVFVPAECVTGIEFQTGLAQEEADQTDVSEFQQATIICDTALFDAPGGNEIAGSAFVAGSVWFVNPAIWNLDGVADQAGQVAKPSGAQTEVRPAPSQPSLLGQQAWVELQLTTFGPVVYVPATCVQGLPNFASVVWQGTRSESIDIARENQTAQQIAESQQQIEEFTGQPAEQQADPFDWGYEFLVTLNCTTPIYNLPGGTAIEEIQLVAGQTWFAAPYFWFAPVVVAPVVQEESVQPAEQPDDQMTDEQEDSPQ